MQKVIIKKSKDKQYYFVVVASNGEPIATSEMYTRKSKCRKGITALTDFFFTEFKIVDKTKK